MILTSTTAAVYFEGTRIAKCRGISLSISRETLDTTKQGDTDRSYIPGLRGTSGSASLFYDTDDTAVAALLTKAYEDSTSLSDMRFVFDISTGRQLVADVILTDVSLSVSYGEAQVCEVQFQISGKPEEVL